jgi:phage RecT family recombinase
MSTAQLKSALTGETPADANPYDLLSHQLDNHRAEFQKLLGKEVPVDRFIRTVKNAVLQNPDLLTVERKSLITAALKAASDHLVPDGREAVFNIYNTKVKRGTAEVYIPMAQYLPMVGGMIKKLWQSGHVTYVDAAAVYAHDEFIYERGDLARLVHKPFGGDEPGEITAAYVVVKLTNGEMKREVMWRRDIERVREASKSPNGPGWRTWYDQFAIKSVIKRAYKQLPSTPDLDSLVEADNEAMGFVAQPASAGLALTDNPGEGLDFPLPQDPAREKEPAQASSASEKQKADSEKAPDLHPMGEMTTIDAIAKLEGFTDIDAMGEWTDLLPDEIRHDERFTRAFKKRMSAIKTPKE